MIYTKPYLQTIREEYRDAFRHMSNVKTKIVNECKTLFEQIDTDGTGYISGEDFLKHFVDSYNENIDTRVMSLDDVITALLY